MKKEESTIISIAISNTLKNKIIEFAKANELSVSAVIRLALKAYLSKEKN